VQQKLPVHSLDRVCHCDSAVWIRHGDRLPLEHELPDRRVHDLSRLRVGRELGASLTLRCGVPAFHHTDVWYSRHPLGEQYSGVFGIDLSAVSVLVL